ncbi:hypothetical protein SAMN04488554_0737 [Ruania alba]|uniref:Uncharacterized protein n=1 Tax=Ruania alba TaxID=648782 RepID=A0A1H5DN67_9MICO|nr:hypothetical protein SAMN04488554_0737 [Ruania alba]
MFSVDPVTTGARVEHALMWAPVRMPGRMRCSDSAAMCDCCRSR